MVARDWREGRMGSKSARYRISFWIDENVLKLESDDGSTTLKPLNYTL